MKVTGVFQQNLIQAYKDTKKKIEKPQETVKTDSVEISAAARNLQNISGENSYEASSSRIEALRNQIKNGTYQPNPTLIAKKMLAEMQGSEA